MEPTIAAISRPARLPHRAAVERSLRRPDQRPTVRHSPALWLCRSSELHVASAPRLGAADHSEYERARGEWRLALVAIGSRRGTGMRATSSASRTAKMSSSRSQALDCLSSRSDSGSGSSPPLGSPINNSGPVP